MNRAIRSKLLTSVYTSIYSCAKLIVVDMLWHSMVCDKCKLTTFQCTFLFHFPLSTIALADGLEIQQKARIHHNTEVTNEGNTAEDATAKINKKNGQ